MKSVIIAALTAASVSFATEAIPDAPADSAGVRSHVVTRFTARVSVRDGMGDRVMIEYTSTRAGVVASVVNGMEYCVGKANQTELSSPNGASVEIIGCTVAPVQTDD